MVFITKLTGTNFALTIQVPNESIVKKQYRNYNVFRSGDFASLVIRERRILSLGERRSDLGGCPGLGSGAEGHEA